jgi:FkbM family methyltransferase
VKDVIHRVRSIGASRSARKELAQRVLRPLNLSVEPTYHGLASLRRDLMQHHEIDVVIDGGANVGQYATTLRDNGYDERIISFEPQRAARDHLLRNSSSDPKWVVEGVALGSSASTLTLHRTMDSQSSSLLRTSGSVEFNFLSGDGDEEVEVRTLDSYEFGSANLMLKLDLQGYELEALEGARATLSVTRLVEVELSLYPMYEGSAVIEEVMTVLRASGFTPISLIRGMTDPATHHVAQMDGLFSRRD